MVNIASSELQSGRQQILTIVKRGRGRKVQQDGKFLSSDYDDGVDGDKISADLSAQNHCLPSSKENSMFTKHFNSYAT